MAFYLARSQRREKTGGIYFRGFSKPSRRVQLFLFLNNLAGRWPLLDEVARFFYIGALPALGTLFLAQLLILPRSGTGVSRSKTALALVLALVLGGLLAWGFDLVAGWLHLGNLSPRPWMTRRVNWLVVEPQDDSFPCVELVLAAAVACASWKLNFRWGIVSFVGVVLLALTRLFCGNNYFADVVVGSALGLSSFILCWQCCQRYMAFGQRAREFSLCASPMVVTLVGCYFFALLSPRFEGKLGIGQPAAAATGPMVVGAPTTASTVTQGEGEGMESGEGQAEELALAKRSSLFLPQLEAFLRGKLTPIARPFPLLDVEAAPVKAGTTSYRCAAIRFEVPAEQPHMRRLVADRAARLVQTAFALDSRLQNVDVVAVARDENRNLDHSLMNFAGDEVPVFTASVQRKNLVVATPAWANAPGVDGLSWLRARSLIYINALALPDSPEPPVVPPTASPTPGATNVSQTPLPTATGATSPPKTGTAPPSATPKAVATSGSASPTPSHSASSQKTPAVVATPKRTAPAAVPTRTPPMRPQPRATTVQATPTPLPRATPVARATPVPQPHATRTAPPTAVPRTASPTPTRAVAVAGGGKRP